MTPEEIIQLFFQFARDGESNALTRKLQTMGTEELIEFKQFTFRQGIAPILYDHVRHFHYDSILPGNFVTDLQQAYHHNAARNLVARAQLEEILTLLENESIPVILLKGAHSCFSTYKNPALRTMFDLDLLFRRSDVANAVAVLKTLGYELGAPSWEGPQHHLPPLIKKGFPFPIEVHHTFATKSTSTHLTPELIWENAQPAALFGHPVWLLSPTLTLFYICLHAAYQHLFVNTARALFDIDTQVRSFDKEIDWETFWETARLEKSISGIALIRNLSTELLSTPLPGVTTEKIASIALPEGIEEDVFEVMLTGEQLPDKPPPGILNALKWWLAKLRKFSFVVSHSLQNRDYDPLLQNQSGVSSLKRKFFLVRDYFSAAANLRKKEQNSQISRADLKLRRWLGVD